VPVSQVIQTGAHAMADRATYLPSLGVLILVVWGGCDLTRGWRYQALACSVAGGAAILLCLPLTRQQIGYWKDGETLFRHALAVTENNAVAHDALGVALDNKGQIDEAIRHFQEAVRLKPTYTGAHYNLGVAFFQRGRTDEAIRQFQEALRLEPDHAQAHNNLGAALGRKGQTDEAIREFQEALRLQPDDAEALRNLNILLANKAAASPPPGGSMKP
jgi:tetratricopeptide (TPR) repeat protein